MNGVQNSDPLLHERGHKIAVDGPGVSQEPTDLRSKPHIQLRILHPRLQQDDLRRGKAYNSSRTHFVREHVYKPRSERTGSMFAF